VPAGRRAVKQLHEIGDRRGGVASNRHVERFHVTRVECFCQGTQVNARVRLIDGYRVSSRRHSSVHRIECDVVVGESSDRPPIPAAPRRVVRAMVQPSHVTGRRRSADGSSIVDMRRQTLVSHFYALNKPPAGEQSPTRIAVPRFQQVHSPRRWEVVGILVRRARVLPTICHADPNSRHAVSCRLPHYTL
jgi:hypothetical protein